MVFIGDAHMLIDGSNPSRANNPLCIFTFENDNKCHDVFVKFIYVVVKWSNKSLQDKLSYSDPLIEQTSFLILII